MSAADALDVHKTSPKGGALAGVWELVRLMLRRDRVKLPAWAGGLGVFSLYLAALLPEAYGGEGELEAIVAMFGGPAGRVFMGPGYGFDSPSFGQIIANGYGLYFFLISALMSILLIVRHTRVEEQAGREELVRASVVGPRAPLAAALIVAVITNLIASTLVAGILVAYGYHAGSSLLFGAAVGAVGVAFAGAAVFTAQLSEHSRACAGMAGAILGAAFVLRGGGDMVRIGGSTLSWFSPLGWATQTAAFVLDRWWPLALVLGFAALFSALGFVLSVRRDVGAGLVAARSGHAAARPWLRSPLSLAWRLQRSTILWWAAALAVSGFMFGGFSDAMTAAAEIETLAKVMGGSDQIILGYLSFMAVYMSYIVGIFAVLSVQGLRREEIDGRSAPVLGTAVSRWSWIGSNLAIGAMGIIVLQALTGFATGLSAAAVTGEAAYVVEVGLAHLAHTPAVLVVLALAALLYGVLPKLVPAAWFVVAYAMFVSLFGTIADAPDIAFDISPFEHIPRLPLESLNPAPVLLLLLIAAVLAVGGMAGFRRRGVQVT